MMANILTFFRMALIVPFAALFLWNAPWNMNAALAVFVAAALTDFFDGRIARAKGEVSRLGAVLDPLADKLLVAAALILLLRNGVIGGLGVVAVIVILGREILVSGLREAAGPSDALKVTGLAKWKTAFQSLAVGLLLAAAPNGLIGAPLRPIAMGVLWFSAVLTFWTGAVYAWRAADILRGAKR
jgi:CDP-diacylglycerol--glycerol-3-phosphate 3-phosphatidyltransferase